MGRLLGFVLSGAVALYMAPAVTQAAGLPLIGSTTVDYTRNTLTVNGLNFGSSPVVTLNNLQFPIMTSSSSQIVADFPNGFPASSFTPGSYFLIVQYRNQLPTIFTVALGTAGWR